MSNADRDRQLYRYPDSNVLRNRLDIRDAEELGRVEARLVENRIEQGVPTGAFDLEHLQDIHRHLFQDVYDWAGDLRQTVTEKGETIFPLNPPLDMGMADVHRRLRDQDYLRNLSRDTFSRDAAEYIGDVNRLHPFREGNGRTQLQYLKQLGEQAGHSVDLTRLERDTWIQASIEANGFQTDRMAQCIGTAIVSNEQVQGLDFNDLKAKAEARRSRQEQSQGYDQGEDL